MTIPIMQDRSEIERVLDRCESGLEKGQVPTEIFGLDSVFDAELRRIFARSWVFVAHETEIPNRGDYVLRRIGLDPVIVTRDDSGNLNVLSNHCRHRGTQVCLTDRGNAHSFRCPYHGWVYKNNGDWMTAPHLKEAYGKGLDPKEWGLLRAPHVDSHQGFIFACLAEEAPTLKEFLGGAAWMLDALVGLHPDGMRVMGPPDRYKVRANWKSGAENFAGDAYHVDVAHWGVEAAKYIQGMRGTNEFGRSYELGNGHNFLGHALPEWFGPLAEVWGYPPEIRKHFDLSRLDETQRHMVTNNPPTVGNIFPNLSFIRFQGSPAPGEPPAVYTSFRQWQPLNPGELELLSWQFTWKFLSDEESQPAYAAGQLGFGSAGIFEQDDTAAWEGIERAGRSLWHQDKGAMFHYGMGRNEGAVQVEPDPSWKGPGIYRPTGFGEHRGLAFYRHWLSVMRKPT